jgi:flagellar assembly protein FliH
MPFAFDDLSVERDGETRAQFISLFSASTREKEEEHEISSEDRARKAFEDAYVQGEKAGYEMGMRRVESIAKRLEKQIGAIASFKNELIERYEKLSAELALMFAEAIVLRECSENREVLTEMIKKALGACEDRGGLVVRVRAEDARYIEGLGSAQLKIITDDMLKEPGFIIETNIGDIDGRISTQIEELRTALIGYHVG